MSKHISVRIQPKQSFRQRWPVAIVALIALLVVVAIIVAFIRLSKSEPSFDYSTEDLYEPWRRDQITYIGAVKDCWEKFAGFGYDDQIQDCFFTVTSAESALESGQSPLEQFDRAIGMVTKDGEVGIWQYVVPGSRRNSHPTTALSPIPANSESQPVVTILEDWTAPQEWHGHVIVIARCYPNATPADSGLSVPTVYFAQNGTTWDTLSESVPLVNEQWHWRDGQYWAIPLAGTSSSTTQTF